MCSLAFDACPAARITVVWLQVQVACRHHHDRHHLAALPASHALPWQQWSIAFSHAVLTWPLPPCLPPALQLPCQPALEDSIDASTCRHLADLPLRKLTLARAELDEPRDVLVLAEVLAAAFKQGLQSLKMGLSLCVFKALCSLLAGDHPQQGSSRAGQQQQQGGSRLRVMQLDIAGRMNLGPHSCWQRALRAAAEQRAPGHCQLWDLARIEEDEKQAQMQLSCVQEQLQQAQAERASRAEQLASSQRWLQDAEAQAEAGPGGMPADPLSRKRSEGASGASELAAAEQELQELQRQHADSTRSLASCQQKLRAAQAVHAHRAALIRAADAAQDTATPLQLPALQHLEELSVRTSDMAGQVVAGAAQYAKLRRLRVALHRGFEGMVAELPISLQALAAGPAAASLQELELDDVPLAVGDLPLVLSSSFQELRRVRLTDVRVPGAEAPRAAAAAVQQVLVGAGVQVVNYEGGVSKSTKSGTPKLARVAVVVRWPSGCRTAVELLVGLLLV